MSEVQIIVRWDDVSRYHDRDKFRSLVDLFLRYETPAVLGVIPDNQDDAIRFGAQPEERFVDELRDLVEAGWEVAQHGYRHCKHNESGGLWGVNRASEFAGRTYEEQAADISAGRDIFRDYGMEPVTFIPPWHSYDTTTLRALRASGFRALSDGGHLYPRLTESLLQLPVIFWSAPRGMTWLRLLGSVYTICLHPHLITMHELMALEAFLRRRQSDVVTISSLIDQSDYLVRRNVKRSIFEFLFRIYYRRQG